MKFLKKCILFSVLLFCGASVFANHNYEGDSLKTYIPNVGDKSFLISISPIFSYFGNMFNNSTGNNLDLSSTNLIFRKFKDNNIARRYRLKLNFSLSQYKFNDNEYFPQKLYNGKSTSTLVNLNYAFGKEKRHHLKYFSFYTGWEFLTGFSHTSTNSAYQYNDGDVTDSPYAVFYLTRVVSNNVSNRLYVGAAGLLGADYYFTKMFYVNMELTLPFVIGAELEKVPKYEEVNILMDSKVVQILEKETEKPTLLFFTNFSSTQLFQFRAGILF
jgi:hypothetical protein